MQLSHLRKLALGALTLPLALAAAVAAPGSALAADLAAGTYSLTANLVMPGKYNLVLTGVDVYACNPNNPFGPTIDENTAIKDSIEGTAPTTPVSNNAQLIVGDDGSYTLYMPTPNPIFTLQEIGATKDGSLTDIKAEYVTATKMHGNAGMHEGSYNQKSSRIRKVEMTVADTAAVEGAVTYDLYNSKMYAVPLNLSFDITGTNGNVSLNLMVDYDSASRVSDSTEVPALETEKTVVNIPEKVALEETGAEQTGVYGNAGYALSGDATATEAGRYKAVATLNEGYVWSDGTTDAKTIKWTLGDVEPWIEFSDVTSATDHASDIEWLADAGISTGFDNGDGTKRFEPYSEVARCDMAAFLYRLAGSPEYEPRADIKAYFSDVDEETPHYKEVLWLAEAGISKGWDVGNTHEFRPYETVKRCDMAAFLRRLSTYLGKSGDVVPADAGKVLDLGESHADDILWLVGSGVSAGWDNGDGTCSYKPLDTVKRCDMAAFLHRMSAKGLV